MAFPQAQLHSVAMAGSVTSTCISPQRKDSPPSKCIVFCVASPAARAGKGTHQPRTVLPTTACSAVLFWEAVQQHLCLNSKDAQKRHGLGSDQGGQVPASFFDHAPKNHNNNSLQFLTRACPLGRGTQCCLWSLQLLELSTPLVKG